MYKIERGGGPNIVLLEIIDFNSENLASQYNRLNGGKKIY